MTDCVYINGEVTTPEEAKISVYDRGFLFGDAVYEVTRSYGRILFGIEPHVDRLFRSAQSIRLDLGCSQKEMIELAYQVYQKANADNYYLRIQISRGNCKIGPIQLSPQNTSKPNVVMFLHPLAVLDPKIYSDGVALVTSRVHRNSKKAMDPNIKSGNYLNNILGFWDAIEEQASDAILLNDNGDVTEGTTFNVHIVKSGKVFSPSEDMDILKGITRKIVFSQAQEIGVAVEQKSFSLQEMLQADEVFITSSTKEVVPVCKINQKVIGNGKPGSVTKKLADSYKVYVKKYCDNALLTHPWRKI